MRRVSAVPMIRQLSSDMSASETRTRVQPPSETVSALISELQSSGAGPDPEYNEGRKRKLSPKLNNGPEIFGTKLNTTAQMNQDSEPTNNDQSDHGHQNSIHSDVPTSEEFRQKMIDLSGFTARKIDIRVQPDPAAEDLSVSSVGPIKVVATAHLLGSRLNEKLTVNGSRCTEMTLRGTNFQVIYHIFSIYW